MIDKLLETITGKDDLERVAYKENAGLLNEYLKTRHVWIPQRPGRYLDAASFTQEELMELIETESKQLGGNPFVPWILDYDGKMRLPVFSSQKRMQTFSNTMSQDMNKVFSLGCIQILLADILKGLNVDFVDLNLFSKKSWEIAVRKSA